MGPIMSGSRQAEVTVLGDVVNTAARVESLTKVCVVDALLAQSTRDLLRDALKTMEIRGMQMRGKSGTHSVHWLLPTNFLPT